MVVPPGQEDVAGARPLNGLEGVLALPFAGVAAEEYERRGCGEALLRTGEGLDEQGDALDRGEAAHVEQDRALGERGHLVLVVGHAARLLAGSPALRLQDEVPAPHWRTIHLPGREALGVVAVRHHEAPLGLDPQQPHRALDEPLGLGDDPRRRLRPAAHTSYPGRGVIPARRRSVVDRLEHEELRAVQVRDDGDPGRDARRRLVQGGEVMEVEDVGLRGARCPERTRPRHDLMLVELLVQGGEDAVGRAGAVLEGRVHGRLGAHGVGRGQRSGEVDGAQVEPGKEPPRVAGARPGARDERHVPPGQRARQGSRDVG